MHKVLLYGLNNKILKYKDFQKLKNYLHKTCFLDKNQIKGQFFKLPFYCFKFQLVVV